MHRGTPSAAHPEAIPPEPVTCWAYTFHPLPDRASCQVTNAPPAPSGASEGATWLPGAVHTPMPSAGHPGGRVPEPVTWASIVFGTVFGAVQLVQLYRRRFASAVC